MQDETHLSFRQQAKAMKSSALGEWEAAKKVPSRRRSKTVGTWNEHWDAPVTLSGQARPSRPWCNGVVRVVPTWFNLVFPVL
ncbi:hypothetical protein EPI10_001858 [Gossypium australe]|uniref:Uncharacterized protein n=1 Tax=Gossypium australe TaxID=47621 RepID=A0A5B6VCP1_9ROSI|nr:hypothetical protein EPI10_001858 [Gossypium australe]